jgi:hypothetical protein
MMGIRFYPDNPAAYSDLLIGIEILRINIFQIKIDFFNHGI